MISGSRTTRHFNPRPPRGGRRQRRRWPSGHLQFQSTPPARGATLLSKAHNGLLAISIHAPREGGDSHFPTSRQQLHKISIHAPREGGDCLRSGSPLAPSWISIHAPREGGDTVKNDYPNAFIKISIHAPREGGDFAHHKSRTVIVISIHAPREGGDLTCLNTRSRIGISIHAPREGGDSKDAQFYLRIFDKQVELLRFLGKIRGGCLRNPEKDRRFFRKSLANLPAISGHLDFAGSGKARPGYPCAVPLPRRAACVRGSGDPPADRCSSYRNAPLFSHIASPDSKSADCLSQNP